MRRVFTMLRPALGLMLLVLPGCSDGAEDAASSETGEAAIPVEPGGGIGDGATPPAPPAIAQSIPRPFIGVWDHDQGSCDPASDARMEIGPRAIEFYESHGEVSRVEIDDPDRITVSLAMEGEGERWQIAQILALSDDGRTLTASSADEDLYDPVKLKRCDS